MSQGTDRWMDKQADRHTRTSLFHGDWNNMENFLITPQYLISDFSTKPPPVKIYCHTHASCLILNKQACVWVFSYARKCSWYEKAILSHYPSVVTVCCFLWVWLHYHLPLRPIFHFQHTTDFLCKKQVLTEFYLRQAKMKTIWYHHYNTIWKYKYSRYVYVNITLSVSMPYYTHMCVHVYVCACTLIRENYLLITVT